MLLNKRVKVQNIIKTPPLLDPENYQPFCKYVVTINDIDYMLPLKSHFDVDQGIFIDNNELIMVEINKIRDRIKFQYPKYLTEH